jgi:DUF1365 family protein
MTWKSALYVGEVEHRRLAPKKNIFSYSVCYYFLDLDEAPHLFRFPLLFSYNFPGILSFWRKDYLGEKETPLKESIQDLISEVTHDKFEGSISLLTNISYFGFCFNPVSFYYCFSPVDQSLQFVVSEITNTPWGEKHRQVFSFNPDEKKKVFHFPKDFHVSPFMPMTIDYTWVFHSPSEDLTVYMQNRNKGEKDLIFDTTLKLKRKKLSATSVVWHFLQFPFITFKTMVAIYYQAAKLYLKRIPFYTHPSKENNI